MAEEIKNQTEDEIIKSEDTNTVDTKDKLIAFSIKNLLIGWKRLAILIAILGAVALLFSGYSCSYKSFTCSKTQTSIPSNK